MKKDNSAANTAALQAIREWAESSHAYLSNREGYARGFREGITNAKETVLQMLEETDPYAEVITDYHDDEHGAWAVDAYVNLIEDDEDNGHTVAWIRDDGKVEWTDQKAKNSALVNEAINEKLKSMKS